jgi:hypothetical protein
MNPPKVTDEDYINFIITTPRVVTATEAKRVQPESTDAPAIRRLLPDFRNALNPIRKRFRRKRERKSILRAAFWCSMIVALEKPYTRPLAKLNFESLAFKIVDS